MSEPTNYAVSKAHPRQYVFFDATIPKVVRDNPTAWAVWQPVNIDHVQVIGESPNMFCARTNHRFKLQSCPICNPNARNLEMIKEREALEAIAGAL